MKVVIMAGGKGTRISCIASNIPKPMISIGGKPILEHEILCLKKQGFTDIIITIGHLGNIIENYFQDGSKLGVKIEYFHENVPLGNAGALFKIKDLLTEDFLLLNADSIFDVDFNRLVDFHKNKNALVTLFAHPNSHPFDSGLLIKDQNDCVVKWISKEDSRSTWYRNLVNAGIHVISPKVLKFHFDSERVDLDRQILKPLCGTGRMFAYCSPEYVRDIGTPDRYYLAINDFESGIIAKKNLQKKQKAIFLDRDGTINKNVGFLTKIDDFELIEGVAEAIKLINNSEYLAIVITNQPVIARGEISLLELREIHDKMETLLGEKGAYIDALYYCPHHPDRGFEGERVEYKIVCECRKPKPGLLFKAANDFNIDLSRSWMVGDGENDMKAGLAAGCNTILLSDKPHGNKIIDKNLLDAVERIIGKNE